MDASLVTTSEASTPIAAQPVSAQQNIRKWGMLVILSLALAIIVLDTTILNVALSHIIIDLHTTLQKLQWVITAYALTLTALTITGGRLGDIFGRKRMFILGAILFAVGSFIASISTSVGELIIGEAIIEGIGAALMMPATSSLLVSNFKGRDRAIAFGIWGGIAGAAAAIGPILGGYLTTHYNWRWGFRINLFVVIVLIIGSFLIKESRDTKTRPRLDFVGVILSAVGLLSFIFGIIEASDYGWWAAKQAFPLGKYILVLPWNLSVTPYNLVIGLIILGLFLLWEKYCEKQGHTPLVSLHIFKNRQFTAGALTMAVLSLGQAGLIFALPVFLQAVRHQDAFHTGLSLLPMSLSLLVFAPLSAALSKKIPPKWLIHMGLFATFLSYLLLRSELSITTTATDLIPGLILFGIGMGMVFSQISNITLSAVSVQEAGEASGINNTMRQLGSTLGSAIIGTILLSTLATQLTHGVTSSTVIPEQAKTEIATQLSTHASEAEFGEGNANSQLSPEIQTEITSISQRATVEGNKDALLAGTGFAFLGLLVSFLIPKHKPKVEPPPFANSNVLALKKRDNQPLSMEIITELLSTEQERLRKGLPGMYNEVRYIIDETKAAHDPIEKADPRLIQARILWDKGIGQKLGFGSYTEYLATIPPAPVSSSEITSRFPYLVLVDTRLSVGQMCATLEVTIKGTEQTATLPNLQAGQEVYWVYAQDGQSNRNRTAREIVGTFGNNEVGLDVKEGLCLFAIYPKILTGHFIDLPATVHEGFDANAACLWFSV
jgi:EmrB/QacA subfamily drug resistance transporter